MFLKFCVTNAIEEFIKINGLDAETITLFNRGAIDRFMPVITQRRLDAKQGAILIISGTILDAVQSGDLNKLKEQSPNLYNNLETLWKFYCTLLADDEQRWKNEILRDNYSGSLSEYVKQCA